MKRLPTIALWACALFLLPETAVAQEIYALEPVMVTAQKVEEELQQVPIAITVLDNGTITDSGTRQLSDLGSLVPSLNISQHIDLNRLITMRGVGAFSRNIGFDARVGVYLDGVYLGTSAGLNLEMLDIERVEVMRGPQGTLWGQNTGAGAINIISKKPDATLAGQVELRAGEFDQRVAKLDADIPLIANKVLTGLAYSHSERAGLIDNLLTGTDLADQNTDAVRAKTRVLISERAEFNLNADASFTRRHALFGNPLTDTFAIGPDQAAPGQWEVAFNQDPSEATNIYGLSGTLDYQLPRDFLLTSITAWRGNRCQFEEDLDYSPLRLFSLDYIDHFGQYSQELRLNSPQEQRLTYTLGLYLSRQDRDTDRTVFFDEQLSLAGIPSLIPGSTVSNRGEMITTTYSLYGHGNYALTAQLSAIAGLRYTYEKKAGDYRLDGSQSGIFNIATFHYDDSNSDATLSPTVGLSYLFTEAMTGYATVTTGYKSPGVNLDFLSNNDLAAGLDFAKETVVNYELGLKTRLLDNRLTANLALFHARYDDFQAYQLMDLGGGASALTIKNAAKAISQGGELEVEWRPAAAWRLSTSLSLVDAYFQEFPGGGVAGADASGNDLPYAPHFVSQVGVGYTVPREVMGGQVAVQGSWLHTGRQYTTPPMWSTRLCSAAARSPSGSWRARTNCRPPSPSPPTASAGGLPCGGRISPTRGTAPIGCAISWARSLRPAANQGNWAWRWGGGFRERGGVVAGVHPEGTMRIRLLAAGLTVALHLALGLALSRRQHPGIETLPPPMYVAQCRLLEPVPRTEAPAAPAATTAGELPQAKAEAIPSGVAIKTLPQKTESPPAQPKTVRSPRREPPQERTRPKPGPAKVPRQSKPPPADHPSSPPIQPPASTAAQAGPATERQGGDLPAVTATPTPGGAVSATPEEAPLSRRTVVENKPQYQVTPKPAYPALARRMGYQGTVELELLVAVEGTVGEARLVRSSGYTLLDSAAMAAVRGWRFEPGTRDGQQVAMWIKVPVNFSLR